MKGITWVQRHLTACRGMLLLGGLFLIVEPLMLRPSSYLGFTLITAVGLLIHCLMKGSFSVPSLVVAQLVLALALSSALFSGYRWNGLEYALVLFAVAGFGLLLSVSDRPRLERDLIVFFLVVGSFHLCRSGYEYVRQIQAFGWLGWYRFPVGALRNPNIAGRFFGLVGLMLLTLGPSRSRRGWRWGAGALFLLTALMTGSRGAILGILFAPVPLVWNRTRKTHRPWWIVLTLLVVAVGTLLLVGNLSKVTNLQRIELVPETLDLLAERPFLGVGGWNFGLVYPSVSQDVRWQRHPHSLPLIVGAEFGGVGLLVGVGVAVWWLWGFQNGIYLPPILFLIVHEAVDTMFWIPGVVLLMVPPLLLARRRSRKSTPRMRWPAVVMAGVVLTVCGWVIWTSSSYRKGLREARQNRWARAASSWEPRGAGFISVHRALAAWKQDQPRRCLRFLRTAEKKNRYDPFYPYLLGSVLKKMGRPRTARLALKRARRMDPRGMIREPLSVSRTDSPVRTLRSRADLPDSSGAKRSVKSRPRRADSYLGLVDRALRNGDYRRARRQLDLLDEFSYRTRRVRRKIIERRILIYNLTSNPRKQKQWVKRLRQLHAGWFPARRQYHHFFYRRSGLDYAFFR